MPGEGQVGCETGRIFRRSFYFLSFRVKSQEKKRGRKREVPGLLSRQCFRKQGVRQSTYKEDFSWLTKRLNISLGC